MRQRMRQGCYRTCCFCYPSGRCVATPGEDRGMSEFLKRSWLRAASRWCGLAVRPAAGNAECTKPRDAERRYGD